MSWSGQDYDEPEHAGVKAALALLVIVLAFALVALAFWAAGS